ncbi:MAG: hypothetical protein ACI4RA_02130, partial [Kiritimatiellia bacterium]
GYAVPAVAAGAGETTVEQAVGLRESRSVVAEGADGQTGLWMWGPESRLTLSVADALTLDVSKFVAASNAALRLQSGDVTLTGFGHDPEPVPAPEALSRAALWMDAGQNVVFEENGTDVREWHDVREAVGTAAADCHYLRAVADHSFSAESPVVQTIGADKPSLYFGGAQSGIAMHFSSSVTADGVSLTNGLSTICHAFYVHGVYNAYGYVLGGARNVGHSFGLVRSEGAPDQPIAGQNATDCTELYHSRVYQNGELVDPQHTPVLRDQLSLHEYEFLNPGRASAFYNERFLNGTISRTGGDNLCEVVIFTNRLTEVERLSVGAYLMDKWLGRPARPPALSLARAATVAFEAEQLPAELSGDGTLTLPRGPFALTNAAALRFGGSVAPAPGVSVQMGPALPLTVAAAKTIQVEETTATVLDGPAKTITKTGRGPAILATLPADLERLDVVAGSLTLTGARTGATGGEGPIRDPDVVDTSFEGLTGGNFNRIETSKLFENGVRVYVNAEGSVESAGSYGGPYRTLSGDGSVGTKVPAADGEYAMFLSRGASCSIPVTFYTEGVYRLQFSACGRLSHRQGQRHHVKIVQDGVTNLVATVTTWAGEFIPYAYLTPKVRPGAAELLFEGFGEIENGVLLNAGSLFDAVSLTYYGEGETVVKVPQGDFEGAFTCPIRSDATRATPEFSVANVLPGWTFTQGPLFDEQPAYGPQVALAQPHMGSGVRRSRFFNLGENRWGVTQLTLFGTGANAVTEPFDVPAGAYRVRADIGWFTVTQPGGTAQTSYVERQTVNVSVRAGEGDWVQVGTFSTKSKFLTPTLAADSFVVKAGEKVALKFETTVARGCMLMDNVVLVPQGEGIAPGTKVLANDRPASALEWTMENHTDEGGEKSSAAQSSYSTNPANNFWGVETCPAAPTGSRFLILTQRASASRPVTFPTAGRYRLSVWAAQRHDMTGQPDRGNCPFEVWLKDHAGAVRRLGHTRVDHDEFLQYAFTFDVAEIDRPYTLGLQGVQFYVKGDPSNNHSVRLDCVDLEYLGDRVAEPEIPETLTIDVAAGASLRLDFPGTNTIYALRIAGRGYTGFVSAAERPELGTSLSGPGTLYIRPRGTVMLYR